MASCSGGSEDDQQKDPMEWEGSPEVEKQNCVLRDQYRGLITDLNNRDEADVYSILEKSARNANEFLDKVRKPREAIYDSAVVNLQASIIKQKVVALHANLIEFIPKEFSKKLEMFFNSIKFGTNKKRTHDDMFKKFGRISIRIFPTSPSFYPMANTFEKTSNQLPKKLRHLRLKDEISKTVRKPERMDSAGEDSEHEAAREIERILNILHKVCEKKDDPVVCYFSFVTNPDSFAETIENMFYVSILAKEGAVQIGVDSDNLPFIGPIQRDCVRDMKLHGNYSQSILSLDRKEWESIVKTFDLKRAVITRSKKKKVPEK